MQTEKLIQSLIEQTRQNINQISELQNLDLHTLTWKENPKSWSVLECLEHLNRYGDFYLPQIEAKIRKSNTKPNAEFRSGWLGDFFAKSMLPKEKLNKMNTFKDKNPLNAKLNKEVIEQCMAQQMRLLELLNQSQKVSLNKVKIETTLSSLLKFKLGDTFCFLINHIIRHLNQIERVREKMKEV